MITLLVALTYLDVVVVSAAAAASIVVAVFFIVVFFVGWFYKSNTSTNIECFFSLCKIHVPYHIECWNRSFA